MTRRVVLHVGTPKSGTTFVQQVLADNVEALAAAGVHVAGQERIELVHAAMVVRDDPRLATLPERAGGAWDRLRAEVRASAAPVVVVSYELFAGASAEQAGRAIADLRADGREVDVVVTGRDLGRIAGSAWQERLKFALTTPYEEWEPPAESVLRADWGWRTLDPVGVAVRWSTGLPDERVHLVTVPRGGGTRELWDRFAEAAGLTDADDGPGPAIDVVVRTDRVNETLGPAAAEVLRRVNLLLDAPIDTPREQALWLRDLLAHEVLAGLDPERIGGSPHLLEAARAQHERAVAALAGRSFTWHGDPADLEPTSAPGTTPGGTSDAERLAVAVRAIWALVLRVREAERRATAATDAPVTASTPRGLGRLVPGVRRMAARVAELEDEVARLDAALDESRRLQHRVALLTDLVGELLLPASEQRLDLGEAIRTYRTGVL